MLAVWRPACTAGLFSFGMAGVQWRDRLHSSQGIVCREGAWWGWKQIPPCSLRSLVGMTRILVQGHWIALFGVRGVGMAADSSLLAALARRNDKDFGARALDCVVWSAGCWNGSRFLLARCGR